MAERPAREHRDWRARRCTRWHTRTLGSGSRHTAVSRTPTTRRPERKHHEEGHPPRVRRDRGHLHLRQHVHHAQHRDERHRSTPTSARTATRSTRASRRSSTPAAAWPGSRSATARQPASSDADAGPRPASPSRPPSLRHGAGRLDVSRRSTAEASEERACSKPSTSLLAEHAELERELADPGVTPTRRSAKTPRPAVRRAHPVVAHLAASGSGLGDDLGAARELAAEDAVVRRRGRAARARSARSPRSGCGTCSSRATRPTTRTSSSRSRRARAARSRRCSPATCCGCTCGTPSARAGRPRSSTPPSPTSAATRRHRRGQGARARPSPATRRRAAEVRGRRAPRPAGAGHRVAGPHPHLRGRRARDARGRGDRRRDRRERPAHRRLPRRGPGGQSVNTTDSAVRITHLPTGIVVAARTRSASCRTRSRRCGSCAPGCWPPPRRRPTRPPASARRSQVRTVDRSERIRTYNFPENRISDHRVGYKAYNLDQVLDGDLEPVVDSCVEADLDGAAGRGRGVS